MEAEEIRALRATLGLTWKGFAHRVGVHWVTVWRWESGRNRPRGLQLHALQRLQARPPKGIPRGTAG